MKKILTLLVICLLLTPTAFAENNKEKAVIVNISNVLTNLVKAENQIVELKDKTQADRDLLLNNNNKATLKIINMLIDDYFKSNSALNLK